METQIRSEEWNVFLVKRPPVTRWGQTFVSHGRSLAGLCFYATDGTAEHTDCVVTVRQGGPLGAPVGVIKTAPGHNNIKRPLVRYPLKPGPLAGYENYYSGKLQEPPDLSNGDRYDTEQFLVAYAPDETPLMPGQTYYLDLAFSRPVMLYGDGDFYPLGHAYYDGARVDAEPNLMHGDPRFTLAMVIVTYENVGGAPSDFGPPISGDGNLLANPGGEAESMRWWKVGGHPDVQVSVNPSGGHTATPANRTGNHHFGLTVYGSVNVFQYQEIDVVPGASYTAGMWVSQQDGNDESIQLAWVDGTFPGNEQLLAEARSAHNDWRQLQGAPFAPSGSRIALVIRYRQSIELNIGSMRVDDVYLLGPRPNGSPSATPTTTPSPAGTGTPTPTATPAGTLTIIDALNNNAAFDADWIPFGASPSRVAGNQAVCGGQHQFMEIQSAAGGYYRRIDYPAGGQFTVTMEWVRGQGARGVRVDAGGGTDAAMYTHAWNSNAGGWPCQTPNALTGTVGAAGRITIFLYTNDTGQFKQLRVDFAPGAATPIPTDAPDTDGDGIADALEGWPPGAGQSHRLLPDSDGDGLRDGEEDANRNGARDAGETDTRGRDSDGDQLWDGIEARVLGADPLDAASPGTFVDADQDGLPASHDLFDLLPDSDGDRFGDGYEAAQLNLDAVYNAAVRPRLGDANGDGAVTNVDALLTQALFLSLVEPGAPAFGGSGFGWIDANRDGQITNVDALMLQSFFLGLLQRLP